MDINEVIEDFEQILESDRKLEEEIPYDDIGFHRDLDSDMRRYESAIEALNFQKEYQDKIKKCIDKIENEKNNIIYKMNDKPYSSDIQTFYRAGKERIIDIIKEEMELSNE